MLHPSFAKQSPSSHSRKYPVRAPHDYDEILERLEEIANKTKRLNLVKTIFDGEIGWLSKDGFAKSTDVFPLIVIGEGELFSLIFSHEGGTVLKAGKVEFYKNEEDTPFSTLNIIGDIDDAYHVSFQPNEKCYYKNIELEWQCHDIKLKRNDKIKIFSSDFSNTYLELFINYKF